MTKKRNLKNRPLGSGVFALIVGIMCIICAGIVYFTGFNLRKIESSLVFNIYLLFGGAVLIGWGLNRVIHNDGRWIVGQNTINFVLAIVATALAILSILIS